ncbi:response regulator transcription factor [Pseudalkalibacillus hwajinpoensis]|uniref:response regulator transcription factor n=1 Tax=Guptibacillus hwajinpoensis TaxID=208199 RepID=UPI00325BACBF
MSGLYRVLVVDDEMLIRQGIINYIDWEQEGFQIVGEASNGNEALSLIESLQPHIILTDVVMPGMDGIELVRVVKEKYPAIEIMVLSSFENFDYVRSTFQSGVADYILKPKLNAEGLIKTLRRIVPNRPVFYEKEERPTSLEELVKKRVLGDSLTSEEKALLEGFTHSEFCLIAVCGLENEENVLTFKELNNQVMKQVDQIETLFIPLDESDTMVVLLNFTLVQLPTIKQSMTNLAKKYKGLGASKSWLMSVPFSSIHELNTVYEDSLLKMKDYLFYLPDEPVLIHGSLPKVEKNSTPFDLSQFIDLFKQKNFAVAIHSLEANVDVLTSHYTIDIFEFKSWLENIMFNMIVLLGNMKYGVDELEAKKYEYFADINEAQYAKEAIARFHDFLEVVKRIVLIEDSTGCPPNMQRLLQYIEDHYAEPLSLSTLADYFHFNPSYLSSYFSTHHKLGFSDYVNQVRIAKAKHILASSSASVSQVSERVGYSEPSYFCKVFKRIEGLSPGRYRKNAPAMN